MRTITAFSDQRGEPVLLRLLDGVPQAPEDRHTSDPGSNKCKVILQIQGGLMESQQLPDEAGARFTKSWTAYLRPAILFLIMLLIGIALTNVNGWLAALFILPGLALFVVQALTIRSVVLYTNDQGVWVYSGIFPWSKGVRGVKWRDVEDALYFPNFFSWLLKSHTVRIGHRFTKSSEIFLQHISRGDHAVMHINDYHSNVLAATSPAGMA
jgi:hypothetical protein